MNNGRSDLKWIWTIHWPYLSYLCYDSIDFAFNFEMLIPSHGFLENQFQNVSFLTESIEITAKFICSHIGLKEKYNSANFKRENNCCQKLIMDWW